MLTDDEHRDLRARLRKAADVLRDDADARQNDGALNESARLWSKADGVLLALGYLRGYAMEAGRCGCSTHGQCDVCDGKDQPMTRAHMCGCGRSECDYPCPRYPETTDE